VNADLQRLAAEALAKGGLDGMPDGHFINGAFVAARSGRSFESLDPGTGKAFARFAAGDADDVADAVGAAERALAGPWGRMKPAERGRILMATAGLIRANAHRLAVAESLDVGKPVGEALGDVMGAARAFEYYAGAADKIEGEAIPLGRDYHAFTVNEPVGVTAHIVPWNYPISTTARSLAPALAAGCTAVVKPAETTPATALMLAALLSEAGLPAGVVNVVTGFGGEAGAPLVAHPAVRHVTFTGSVATGQRVMKAAADNVTRVLLELGGKSPLVVLADADLEAAAEGVIGAIFENAGQICSAGSRLVVERNIHAALLEKVVARAKALRIGHGLRNPQLGPVNSAAQLAKVAGFVEAARARGRAVATGGKTTADPETGLGWFYEPTVIDDLPADDPIVREEIFGPVLAVQVVDGLEEAVAAANGTDYGLVAGIYTRDLSKALAFARDVDAGQVYVNEYFAGGIEVPFGGNRLSGFGREKGLQAVASYCRLKSVAVRI
jgi:aldehyde dehydrogenase (NAD+)/betaine-aldehyde dehydrogenase